MRPRPQNVKEYLSALPPEHRAAVRKIRRVLKQNLPRGFEETFAAGMIGYVVPHSLYPAGYHCDPAKPLPFIQIASRKEYIALHHMGLYDPTLMSWLERAWSKHSARELDCGRCCIRFRRIEEIPFSLIGDLAAQMSPESWIRHAEKARSGSSTMAGRSKRAPSPAKRKVSRHAARAGKT